MAREFAKKFYKSKAWQQCREAVLKRDHYLCTECGEAGQEVHHIEWLKPENINDTSITLNMDNLATLCKDCHHKAHERNQYSKPQPSRIQFDIEGNIIICPHSFK